jgi:hypothetical protein
MTKVRLSTSRGTRWVEEEISKAKNFPIPESPKKSKKKKKDKKNAYKDETEEEGEETSNP